MYHSHFNIFFYMAFGLNNGAMYLCVVRCFNVIGLFLRFFVCFIRIFVAIVCLHAYILCIYLYRGIYAYKYIRQCHSVSDNVFFSRIDWFPNHVTGRKFARLTCGSRALSCRSLFKAVLSYDLKFVTTAFLQIPLHKSRSGYAVKKTIRLFVQLAELISVGT